MTRSTNMEHVEVLRAWIRGENVATEAFCQAVDAAIDTEREARNG